MTVSNDTQPDDVAVNPEKRRCFSCFFLFFFVHSEGPIVDTQFSPPKSARIRHTASQKTEAQLTGFSGEKYKRCVFSPLYRAIS